MPTFLTVTISQVKEKSARESTRALRDTASVGKPRGVGFPITDGYRAALIAWIAAEKGRSESSLAREIGCTPAAINQITTQGRPTSSLLPKISRVTGIPLPFPGLPVELQQYMSDFVLLYDEAPEDARGVASLATKLRSRK